MSDAISAVIAMPYQDALIDPANVRTRHVASAITEPRWKAIRPNLMTVAEAANWVPVFDGPFTAPPADEADRPVLAAAAAAVPGIDWGADPWHALTDAVKDATGAKGRTLFLPLRRALTGRDHGPDMAEMLPLIAKEQAVARLSAV